VTGHIVVTGCAGFIGSHLTDRLLADGRAVVGSDSPIHRCVCVLRLLSARDDICMLPKRR
jgi:nucleoside-diphosphate-sugar epimerase